jgi:cobyrinic acid a,c-diamide synthase
MHMTARGLIVAAPASGAGKTTITAAMIAGLRRRGLCMRAAKAGPDYIDPGFHAAATGAPCVNLDSWAMPPALLDALVAEAAVGADLLVIEGVMGLFDGISGAASRTGATADLAARYDLPVLLVVDVSRQAQSAAAVVRGFASHDPQVRIAGVVLNRVGSERHGKMASDAIAGLGIAVFGVIPRDETLVLPERHLGLVQANEHIALAGHLDRLGELAERRLDLAGLLAAAALIPPPSVAPMPALPPPGQRIALASDAAFTFVYPHVLDGWRRAGAEIVPFSPLADQAPGDDCDCCWLPGGYPELHAGPLAAARHFRGALAHFAQTRRVHGECGGYMVLGQGLEDAHGIRHQMTGLLGHATSFAKRKLHLGYREARLLADCPIGRAGALLRGHEFHYATLTEPGHDAPFAVLGDGQARELGHAGARRHNVTGTFFHAIAQQDLP